MTDRGTVERFRIVVLRVLIWIGYPVNLALGWLIDDAAGVTAQRAFVKEWLAELRTKR